MKFKYTQEMLTDIYRLIGRYLNREEELVTDKPILVFAIKGDVAKPVLVKGTIETQYPIILPYEKIYTYVLQYRVAESTRKLTRYKEILFKELKLACEQAEKRYPKTSGVELHDKYIDARIDYEAKNHKELMECYAAFEKVNGYLKTFGVGTVRTLYSRLDYINRDYSKIVNTARGVKTYAEFVGKIYPLTANHSLADIKEAFQRAYSII